MKSMFYHSLLPNIWNLRGKQHLATQEKYYLVDLGLRYALLGKELTTDVGHLLENVIYLELLRRNYQIWIGKTYNLEVDFVVRDKIVTQNIFK